MGNEEGGVDLLLLNELGQRLEITLHVRLAAAQPQALLHDRAHVDGNRAPVDAGNRDHTARPHRHDGLVENIGALGQVSDLTQNQVAAGRDQVVSAMGAASDGLSQSAATAQDKFTALEGDVELRIRRILGVRWRSQALLDC